MHWYTVAQWPSVLVAMYALGAVSVACWYGGVLLLHRLAHTRASWWLLAFSSVDLFSFLLDCVGQFHQFSYSFIYLKGLVGLALQLGKSICLLLVILELARHARRGIHA